MAIVVIIKGGLVEDVTKEDYQGDVVIVDMDTEGFGDEEICECDIVAEPHLNHNVW